MGIELTVKCNELKEEALPSDDHITRKWVSTLFIEESSRPRDDLFFFHDLTEEKSLTYTSRSYTSMVLYLPGSIGLSD